MNTSPCCVTVLSNHIFQRKTILHGRFWLEKIRKEKQTREERRSQSETAVFHIIVAQQQAPVFDSSQRWSQVSVSQICSDLVWPFWCFIPVFWQHKNPECQAKLKKSLQESRQALLFWKSQGRLLYFCDAHSLALSKTCLGNFVGIALWFLWLWLCSETQEDFLASTSEWICHVRDKICKWTIIYQLLLDNKNQAHRKGGIWSTIIETI